MVILVLIRRNTGTLKVSKIGLKLRVKFFSISESWNRWTGYFWQSVQ